MMKSTTNVREMPMMHGREMMMRGREKVPWSQEVWDRIDEAVHAECERTEIAAKFLPMQGPIPPMTTTVPSDTVITDGQVLEVDETAISTVVELQCLFRMTRQQVDDELERMTAVTLATRCANHLCEAKDMLIFQGQEAALKHNLFRSGPGGVQLKSGRLTGGLIDVPASQTVSVPALPPRSSEDTETRWGENSFGAVAEAYSRLQGGEGLSQAHYGPYCVAFHHEAYADAFAPLAATLIMPADRIKPLVMDCFYGTGTLPPLRGFMISIGGNTVDLVIAQAPTAAYVQDDPDGNMLFRVYTRFALRRKDPSGVIVLKFQQPRAGSDKRSGSGSKKSDG
jgi:uncharacterized linocin/CFP29 family protein